MKFSTGVILSMLSANVFAIEHLNGAHSGSLLARRAVVADTDSPFLHKRNNGEEQDEQEEQAKSKVSSVLILTLAKSRMSTQDDKGKGARKKVYTGLGSGRGKSNFGDAPGDSSSRVLGSIKKKLSRVKLRVRLSYGRQRALTSSNRVVSHFGGREGKRIGGEVYAMFEYAAKTAWGYQGLYKDPNTSPFYLELLPSTPDEPKQKYKWLQDNVPRHIQRHISAIEAAIEHITYRPKHVISELEKLMKQTGDFYKGIFKTKNVYPEWLKELEISDNVYLEGLEMHTKDVEEYKNNLSDRFNKIKEMVEDYRKNSNQQSSSKASSSVLESKERLGIESKPSKDGASSSAQSKSKASSSEQSKSEASSSAQSKSEASSSAQSEDGVVYNLIDFSDDE
ncbi:hypothetical protein BASA50_001980 [Batrachochytrium salamandrivorans]|uniref:Uncharacterized protein n=1 Tax=Batrachochytrium salamandrivorans TaxID=1357716 RepID=A0ABQ8FMI7_9FUNG|nr:hypothetical protein BASA50_001980 [Batrachochytrium salamandrivorans]